MTPATRVLVARALKLREARDRAALAGAQQEHAARLEAAARLVDAMVRERAFVQAADPRMAGATFNAWREGAGALLMAARGDAERAEAACETVRAGLTETLRTAKGFETLMARGDDERAQREARRDPLLHLMVLPGRR